MKYQKLIIILIILISLCSFIFIKANKLLENKTTSITFLSNQYEICKETILVNDSANRDFCEAFIANTIDPTFNNNLNFYTFFDELISFDLNVLCYILFLVIVAPAILWICRTFKGKCFTNNYLRESNYSFLKKIFFESYQFIWILPFCFVLLFAYLSLKLNFNLYEGINNSVMYSFSLMEKPLLYMAVFIVQIILLSASYINLGLLVVRKNKNYLISLIASYLLFIGIELFLEIFIQGILYNLLGYKVLTKISIINMFMYYEYAGAFTPIITSGILFIITFILVIFAYRNKEKLLIDIETKN